MFDPFQRFNYLTDSRYLYISKNPRVCDLEGFDHICNQCNHKRPVVYFCLDPFSEEILGDRTMSWICDECYRISCDEI